MLTSGDIVATDIKLDKYSLKMVDPGLEAQFKSERVKKSINIGRFFFSLAVIGYGIYALVDTFVNNKTDIYNFLRLGVFLIFLALEFFILSEIYNFYYEKMTISLFIVIIIIKIAYDWIKKTYSIILSGVLLSFLTTLNLNLSVIFVGILNIFYYLMILIRFLSFFLHYL